MSWSPSTEPVLCDEFIPVSAQHRDGHRPVLLLSSLLTVHISGIQTRVAFVLLRYSRSRHFLVCYFFILQLCLFVSRLERLLEQVSDHWIAITLAYLLTCLIFFSF